MPAVRPPHPMTLPLGMVQVGRLVLVDGAVAGRAVPPGLERRPAGGVNARLPLAAPPGAPCREQPERAGELAARLGQLVDEARRPLRIGAAKDQATPPEAAQAGGGDV